jgi:pyruvate carboxylase subunit B
VRYFADTGGDAREVTVEEGDLRIDGERLAADISSPPGSDRQHLRMDGRTVSLYARRLPEGWLIELEGREFLVRVEDERARHIRKLASAARPVLSRRELRAPMPGLVVKVEVEPGQEVDEGTGLVIMEAMKMENELRAEAPGRIATVEVEPGQTVDRGQVLLRLE